MVIVVRSCVQSILKLLNSIIGMVGMAVILYAIWLIRVWEREIGDSPFKGSDYAARWFIYASLGLGVTLCVITCAGHIAAETANGCFLYIYMAISFLLIMLEAAVATDVFLNRDWEEDFPVDPSGSFNMFKDFVRSNFDFCKWIGLSVVSVQGLCLLVAMLLKALGPHQSYESDDDIDPERVPLLKNSVHSPYVVGSPVYGSKNDA